MKDLWGESSGMTFYKYEKTTPTCLSETRG